MDPAQYKTAILRMLLSGSKVVLLLGHLSNNFWTNLRLKRRDSVLESVVSDCSPDYLSALRRGVFDDQARLFSKESVREAVTHVSASLQTLAFRKVAGSGASGNKQSSSKSDRRSSGLGIHPSSRRRRRTLPLQATLLQRERALVSLFIAPLVIPKGSRPFLPRSLRSIPLLRRFLSIKEEEVGPRFFPHCPESR